MSLGSPPEGIDLSEDIGSRVIGTDVALIVLATIAVASRIICRFISSAPFWWDDWAIVVSLAFAYANAVITIIATKNGIGKHIWTPGVDIVAVTKLLWIYEFFWATLITITKCSLILFYYRIFPTLKHQRALFGILFLVIGWWIAIIITVGLQCRPYYYFWTHYSDPSSKGVCIDVNTFSLANAGLSVLTDFMILVFPIPGVLKLQMRMKQKLTVLGIFLLAGFACIAGALRIRFLTAMFDSLDATWIQSNGFIWSSIESYIGIVCACLPTLRPLLRTLFPCWLGSTAPRYASSVPFQGAGQFYALESSSANPHPNQAEDGIVISKVGKDGWTSTSELATHSAERDI